MQAAGDAAVIAGTLSGTRLIGTVRVAYTTHQRQSAPFSGAIFVRRTRHADCARELECYLDRHTRAVDGCAAAHLPNARCTSACQPLPAVYSRLHATLPGAPTLQYAASRTDIAVRPDAYRALLECGVRALEQRVGGLSNLGDYLEFGVFNGSSLLAACRQTASMNLEQMRLFGFDSFQGLPAGAQSEDEGVWTAGEWRSELEFTRAVLDAEGVDWSRVTLVPGWFSDTCNGDTAAAHRITKASVIMVDCDLYSSTRQALDFCAPLITDVALVMFDDWHAGRLAEKGLGEKKAFEEWLAEWNCFSAEPFGRYAVRSETFLVTRTS
jgi:hypothetical protein